MPPVDEPKKDPLAQLLDELELLSAQTRSLEQSLQRAQTSAFAEVERFQQQFRARVSDLKTEIRQDAGETIAAAEPRSTGSPPDPKNEDLLRRLAEQQTALQHAHEESERRGAAIAALREQLARVEAINRELEQTKNAAERELEASRREAQAKLAALQSEIAHKTTLLTRNQSTIARLEEEQKALGASLGLRERDGQAVAQTQRAELERLNGELAELRAGAQQEKAAAAEEIRKLRAEIADKQALIEQRDAAQSAERELRNRYREVQGRLAAKESVIESHETHLQTAQRKLLETRDALAEKERALADAQAQAAHHEQVLTQEKEQWQSRLDEAQLLAEQYRQENERSQTELARARETGALSAGERQAFQDRAEQLSAAVDELTNRLRESQTAMDSGAAAARAREAELQAALHSAEETLAQKQGQARDREATLSAEIAALKAQTEQQSARLEERQAALHEIEQSLRAEIGLLSERLAAQDSLLQTQSADLQQAVAQAAAARERLAEFESAARQTGDLQARAAADAERIAGLERDIEAAHRALADRETALQRVRKEVETAAAPASHAATAGMSDQSAELKAARDKIADLLERLAQLEAARQTLQENAGHELQQLRESFEARLSRLRMEMAELQRARAPQPASDQQPPAGAVEERLKQQIRELESRLAEQQTTAAERNEEAALVKRELNGGEQRTSGGAPAVLAAGRRSLELREEDAIDPPRVFANGAVAVGALELAAAGAGANATAAAGAGFNGTRPWNQAAEKNASAGASRRWNIGLFKRRWKN